MLTHSPFQVDKMKKVIRNPIGMPTDKIKQDVPDVPKAQIMELRKLLLNEKADKVIGKLLGIALDDDSPNQMAAIKLCIERMLPMSEFEKIGSQSKPVISINITGVNDVSMGEVIDGEEA